MSLPQDDTHKRRLIDENQQTDSNNLIEEQAMSLPPQEDSHKRRLIDDNQQTDINNYCFTKEAFTAIALNAKKTIIANLIFDEMSIRKQLIYSNGSFEGTVT